MQMIQELINDVGDQVFKPELDESLHEPQTKTIVQQYAFEMSKNRIVVNYIVSALVHGHIDRSDAAGLMKRASTSDGLDLVYTNLIEKVSKIILKPTECLDYRLKNIQNH